MRFRQFICFVLLVSLVISCGDDNRVEPIEPRGDINANGRPGEIADCVMYQNFFVRGIEALGNHPHESFRQSDINRDGLPFGMDDLVLLFEAAKNPSREDILVNARPSPDTTESWYAVVDGRLIIPAEAQVGAVFVQIRGQINPEVTTLNAQFAYRYDGQVTNAIVTPALNEGSTVIPFEEEILEGLDGDLLILRAATAQGQPMKLVPKAIWSHTTHNTVHEVTR